MTCNINTSLLDSLADGELTARERFDLNTHVMQCDKCRSYLEQLRKAKAAVAGMTPPPMSQDFEARLKQKIAAHDNSVVTSSHQAPVKGARMTLWATAATVALTVTGLSYLMLGNTPNEDDLLALDGQNPVIEITTPALPADGIQLASVSTTVQHDSDAYWTDVDTDRFDHFTQVDDGYQDYSCGSTVGEKACTLGPGLQVASLTINSSI